jgi:hypothetical protein
MWREPDLQWEENLDILKFWEKGKSTIQIEESFVDDE